MDALKESPPDRIVRLRCRVLPHLVADGPSQMALDHALLDSVDRNPASVVLRTYEWSVPTLSLGFFQSISDVDSSVRWKNFPVVRRPSGGGALFHHREVTYALVVPRFHPLACRPSALYRAVHSSIGERLRSLGLDARRRGEVAKNPEGKPFLCFLDQDSEDVIVNTVKVVGSAQRRRPSAVLQHGSILLGQSQHTPELLGLSELGITGISSAEWAHHLRIAIAESLGCEMVPDEVSENESEHAARLAAEHYRNRDWTARR
jgi:lipoate-protein ligase A